MDVVPTVLTAVWVMLPAYLPNNVAVLAGGGRPIDGGRTVGGRRLLGDGKTWRGTVAGVLAGVVLALALDAGADAAAASLGTPLPGFSLPIALAFPAGAMAGDIAASFLKRRMDRDRGAAVPGVDQLDFVAGALAFGLLADPGWTVETFTPAVLATVIVLTPLLHLGTNAVGYLLGVKDVPW